MSQEHSQSVTKQTPYGLVSFNEISAFNRLPGFFMEMDNSMAVKGLVLDLSKIVMLGQMLPEGSATPGKIVRVTSTDAATAFFGMGSMLDGMVQRFKAIHPYGDLYVLPMLDDAAATQGTGSFVFEGSVRRGGTINLYIGGRRLRIPARLGQSGADLARMAAEAINSDPSLGVTAKNNEKTCLITHKHACEAVNGFDLRVNYQFDDHLPDGITISVTKISGGTANPDVATYLTALGGTQYHYCITPYTDQANLAAVEAVFRDNWNAEKQIEGLVLSAANLNHAGLTTLGNSLNCEFLSIFGLRGSPSPAWEIAAAYGARAAKHLDEDPARPLQTLILNGICVPDQADLFSDTERNLLLWDGIATGMIHSGGYVQIEREVTTYQLNAWGLPDPSYLDLQTPATCSVLRRTWRTRLSQKFPRHMLADNGSPAALSGKAVATPDILTAEMLSLARDWEESAWVERVDDFKRDLRVMRNLNDVNRVDCILPPNFVNQLRKIAALLQFRL